MQRTNRMAWVLGVERSGSTWLANILSSSRHVNLHMEPFAPYARLLPEWPGRLTYLQSCAPDLRDALNRRFGQLHDAAWRSLTRPERLLARVDETLPIRVEKRRAQLLRLRPSLRIRRFEALSLHRSAMRSPFPPVPPPGAFTVVKELRLNFQIGMIAEAFPGSVFVVVVRDPIAQCASIVSHMERGSLSELRFATIALQTVASNVPQLRHLTEHWTSGGDSMQLVSIAALYWLLAYATLIESLESARRPFLLVPYETLCDETTMVVQEMFDWLSLPMDSRVLAYVEESSTRDQVSPSMVDTQRRSREYWRIARASVTRDVEAQIRSSLDGCWNAMPVLLRAYRDGSVPTSAAGFSNESARGDAC